MKSIPSKLEEACLTVILIVPGSLPVTPSSIGWLPKTFFISLWPSESSAQKPNPTSTDRVPGTQKILLRQQETHNYRDDARCVIGSTWWLPKCFLMFVHKMKLIPTRKHVYGADDKTNEWHWSIPFPPWQLQLWQMSLWMCNSKLMK